ncbi:Flagellar biosynthetic protein fliR [Borrelia nietonii YOR]|uniref:Flagellar biosynthetic protein fliR n=1 Tax=Borrelia nietonii YOR TaxID=1293576 RepID=A0ABN4C7N7_9SPIR|nr:Flagellar biosynthetic protein fliR [Borrelia nietonii YOR]
MSIIVVDKINVVYPLDNLIAFTLILAGEAVLGLIQAFFVSIIFSVFHLLVFFSQIRWDLLMQIFLMFLQKRII